MKTVFKDVECYLFGGKKLLRELEVWKYQLKIVWLTSKHKNSSEIRVLDRSWMAFPQLSRVGIGRSVGVTLIYLQNSIALFYIQWIWGIRNVLTHWAFVVNNSLKCQKTTVAQGEEQLGWLMLGRFAWGCKVLTLKEVFFIFISVFSEGVEKQQ